MRRWPATANLRSFYWGLARLERACRCAVLFACGEAGDLAGDPGRDPRAGERGVMVPVIGDPRLRERLPGVNLAYTGTAGTPGGSDEAVVTGNLIDSEARRD